MWLEEQVVGLYQITAGWDIYVLGLCIFWDYKNKLNFIMPLHKECVGIMPKSSFSNLLFIIRQLPSSIGFFQVYLMICG